MICLSASLVFWWAWAVYGAPIFVVLDKLDVLDGRLRSAVARIDLLRLLAALDPDG